MNKKVLVLYYTQSGQLLNILKSLLSPTNNKNIDITYEEIQMETSFPFPWSLISFLDVMPESVLEIPAPIKKPSFKPNDKFDLVIFAYQPWFLSTSIPATSFLQSKYAAVMKGTPVITVNGSRNMWLMAQEKVKKYLSEIGAPLVMNVPFIDRAPNIASVITIPAWLLTGKKKPISFLPQAGVSEDDIKKAPVFGKVILQYLESGDYLSAKNLGSTFPAEVTPRLINVEKAGRRVFTLWAKLIRATGKPGTPTRTPFLLLFMIYLITVISVLFPLTLLLYQLRRVLKPQSLQQDIDYFSKGN